MSVNGDSSGGSPEFTDLTFLSRTGTVRRVATAKKVPDGTTEEEQKASPRSISPDVHGRRSLDGSYSPDMHVPQERSRKSLDATYRLSLESISEYKPTNSFSVLYPSRDCSSMESSSSDCTTAPAKPPLSPGSSYLSWIESVNSEYFGSAASVANPSAPLPDIDGKVGEWNNFWLNYNSARGRYLTSPYMSTSNEDRTGDEMSDARSTTSTQKDFVNEKAAQGAELNERVWLSVEEANEVLKCGQRIVEILTEGVKRAEQGEVSRNDSYYSQPYSLHNSMRRLTQFFQSARDDIVVQRERSYSYAMDPHEIHKQKQQQFFKPSNQSSSSSCINALLNNSGVADILRRMVKRRDTEETETLEKTPTPATSPARFSFSSAK